MLDIFGGRYRTVRRREPAELPPGRRARAGGPDPAGPAPARGPTRRARGESAKDTAVIQVFLGGGPSHLDTYDPKPDAPREFRGEFRPIATNVPGVAAQRAVARGRPG